MKKLYVLALFTVLFGILIGCGKNEASDNGKDANAQTGEKTVTLKIGASSTPHAEILEFIKPTLEKEGIELDINVINDGIQTNEQTANGELDANYFQHTPYLEQTNKDSGLNLVKVVGVHIEPFGVYSKKSNRLTNFQKVQKLQFQRTLLTFPALCNCLMPTALLSLISLPPASIQVKIIRYKILRKMIKNFNLFPLMVRC